MPLVHAQDGEPELRRSDARARARKIDPAYTRGQLVRVAGGRHQAEAELIQNLLIEEGVPSMLRRSAGFDVPDFLAAGPRDVLVPASGADAARAVLLESDLAPSTPIPAASASPETRQYHAVRLLVAILAGTTLAALVVWALDQLVR